MLVSCWFVWFFCVVVFPYHYHYLFWMLCTSVVLSDGVLSELGLGEFQHNWTSRYQVHVRCRGVLAAKGFIVGVEKK